jgi:hypothetical protein
LYLNYIVLSDAQIKRKEYNLKYYTNKKSQVKSHVSKMYKKTYDAYIEKILAREDIDEVVASIVKLYDMDKLKGLIDNVTV